MEGGSSISSDSGSVDLNLWECGNPKIVLLDRLANTNRTRLFVHHSSGHLSDCTTVRYKKALGQEVTSFEVEVLESSQNEEASVAIGLVGCLSPLSASMPGWHEGDVGLHLDDGKLYVGSSRDTEATVFCQKGARRGDRYACSLEYTDSANKHLAGEVNIALTKNDLPIGGPVTKVVPAGGFFPAVGLLGKSTAVAVALHLANETANLNPPASPGSLSSQQDLKVVGSLHEHLTYSASSSSPALRARVSVPASSGVQAVPPPVVQPMDWGDCNQYVSILDDGSLSYSGRGMVSEIGAAVAFKPLLPTRSFFEVKIIDCGERSRIAVGLCAVSSSQSTLPGWHEESVAYHGDDGYIFFGSASDGTPAGRKLRSGDAIGCGLKYGSDASGTATSRRRTQVFFTLNDSLIGTPHEMEVPAGGFYPDIAMLSPGAHVSASYRSFSSSTSSPQQSMVPSPTVDGNVVMNNLSQKKPGESTGFCSSNDPVPKFNISPQTVRTERTTAAVAAAVMSNTASAAKPAAPPVLPATLWTHGTDLAVQQVERQTQIEYCGLDKRSSIVQYARAGHALTAGCPVFEVAIDNLATDGKVRFGVCPLGMLSASSHLPPGTVLLDVTSGMVLWDGHVMGIAPAAKLGDRFTCAILETGGEGGEAEVVFALNGLALGTIRSSLPRDQCYPIAALGRHGDRIRITCSLSLSVPQWPPVSGQDLGCMQLGAQHHVSVTGSYVSSTSSETSTGVFRWLEPLSNSRPYVQVQVVSSRIPSTVTIGVCNGTSATLSLPVAAPGRRAGSLGFGNGHIISWPEGARSPLSRKLESKSSKYSAVRHMDTLGVGIAKGTIFQGKQLVFFTHNGFVVDSMDWEDSSVPLLPSVGLSYAACVQVDVKAQWPAPTGPLPPWTQLERLHRVHDLLLYSHPGAGDYDVGIAVASMSLSVARPYFEVEIMEPGRGCYVGVGVARPGSEHKGMVGWNVGSVGYHSDDGFVFEGNGQGHRFGPVCQQGDIMGCGVEFEAVTNDGVARPRRLFMTCNRQIIGHMDCPAPLVGVSPRTAYQPMITLHSQGTVVRTRLDLSWPPECSSTLGAGFTRGSLVRFSPPCTFAYTGSRTENFDTGVLQAAEPLTREHPYFEVTLVDLGKGGYIGVGVASNNYPLGNQPGWKPESVAVHADDGKLFVNGQAKSLISPAVQGDTIGCGVKFPVLHTARSERKKGASASSSSKVGLTVSVFFTRNGKIVGSVDVKMPNFGFYPTVGLHAEGAVVQVNLKAMYPPICTLGSLWQQSVRLKSDDGGKTVAYSGKRMSQKDRGIAMAKDPLDQDRSFFAVTLLSSGHQGGDVTIGLVNENFTDNLLQPGEAEASIGFHASSGGLFIAGQPSRLCCAPCSVNDIIGCGVDHSLSITPGRLQSQSKANSHVYFTVNSKIISRVRLACSPHLLYPAVSLHGAGDKVQVELVNPPASSRAKHRSIGWARSHEVQLHGSVVRHLSSAATPAGLLRKSESMGVAQAVLFDADSQEQYFEAILMSTGNPCHVSIGFAPLDMPVVGVPGTTTGSVMLSLANGCVVNGLETPRPCTTASFSTGDTFGCYIAWPGCTAGNSWRLPANGAQIVFLHNRQEIARCVARVPDGLDPGDLLPTIALRGKDEEVFVSVADAVVPPFVKKSEWLQFSNVRQDEKKRYHTLPDMSLPGGSQSGFVQLCTPLSSKNPLFKVKCSKETTGVYAGIAQALFSFAQPMGRAFGSLGCDMETGMIICEGHHVADCPPFTEDDELAIAVDFSDITHIRGMPYYPVYVTRNDVVVGHTTVGVEPGRHIYPSLVLTGDKASVELKVSGSLQRPHFSTLGWMQMRRVTVNSYGHCLRYGGSGDSRNDTGVAIAATALSPMRNYFEISICSPGRDACIAIGLVHAEYRCDYMPGWLPGSVAYHADDGGIFAGQGTTEKFTSTCNHLDVMGCGIDFSANVQAGNIEVFFTRNRQIVATETLPVPPTGIFPAVGLLSPGERVFVDFVPWSGGESRLNIVINDTRR